MIFLFIKQIVIKWNVNVVGRRGPKVMLTKRKDIGYNKCKFEGFV